MKKIEASVQKFITEYRETFSDILQNRLLDEGSLIRFLRERGIAVSGVITGDLGKFLEMGWIESDELPETEKHLFHPFRMYPIHLVAEACRLDLTASSSIDRDSFNKFLAKASDFLPSIEKITEIAKLANEVANLAIILEPLHWPIITSRTSYSGFIRFKEYKKLVDSYKQKVLNLIKTLDSQEWQKKHEKIRFRAAKLDDNGDLYILLRLSPWIKRERTKGKIAGAMWLRHMAEVLRRGFRDYTDTIWLEEDQAFGQWAPGTRAIIYGSEQPTKETTKARPNVAFEFGLHTSSTLRWYLEGETEYFAALYILPKAASGGLELVNLKGAVGNERANAALRLVDCLVQDRELRRFSFISFDMDIAANLKAIRRQVENGNIVGYINCNNPDFEFGNFTLKELIEVAATMDEKQGANSEAIRTGDWSGINSGRQFEDNYRNLSEIGQKRLKGEQWGKALAEYALENPYLDGKEKKRPFLETVNYALQSRRVRYDFQRNNYFINPESFQIEKIPKE